MKKIAKIIATTVAAVALMASSAMAFSLAGGYQGPVYFKYSNWEIGSGGNNDGVVNQVGETLSGIGLVTGIYADKPGPVQQLWNASTANEELTIVFGGYQAAAITGNQIDFTGGFVNVYLDAVKNFNPTFGQANNANDGALFLSTVGAPADASGRTLTSFVSAMGPLFTGFGTGYLDITGGLWADMFKKDVFGPGMDLYMASSLTAPDYVNGWPVSSQDPVKGTVVPEPGTIALFGAGLVGLILYKRKRG